MPLKLTQYNDPAVLNRWADGIEQHLKNVQKQSLALGNATQTLVTLTLDKLPNGRLFRKLSNVQTDGTILKSSSLNPQASITPSLNIASPFTFTTKTHTSSLAYITFSWVQQTLTRPDGSTLTVPASTSNYIPSAPILSETAGGTFIASPAFANSTSQSNASGTTVTGPALTPAKAGDFLVVSVRWTGATTLNSISDSQGNTGWVAAGAAQAIASGGTVQLWYLPACLSTASNTLTYHFSGATTAIYSSYLEFKNVLATSPLRANTSTSGTGLNLNSGNITPTVGDLVISYGGLTSSPSSITPVAPVNVGSQAAGTIEDVGYLPTSAGGATAGKFTSGTSLGWCCGVAAFKPSGVTYRAMIGLVDQDGNIVGVSPVSTLLTDPNNLLVITAPSVNLTTQVLPNYLGWVPIVGIAVDTAAVQASTINFGTDWTEPSSGLLAVGAASQFTESDIANTGNVLFPDLAISTPYLFYPYWNIANDVVRWSGGANASASQANSSVTFADGNMSLASASGISVTTGASGGSGGGSGGGGGCVRKGSKIIPLGHDGWGIELPQEDWIAIQTENGYELVATPNHPLFTERAGKTPLSDVLVGDYVSPSPQHV